MLIELVKNNGTNYLCVMEGYRINEGGNSKSRRRLIRNIGMVMYLGNMVEMSSSDEMFRERLHPYTKALLAAVPIPKVGVKKERKLLKGEISSPVNPKPGCRFANRCEYAREKCFQQSPLFEEAKPGHFVACHYCKEINNM
jgi:peptide/nickel transport system ATP-binding protein